MFESIFATTPDATFTAFELLSALAAALLLGLLISFVYLRTHRDEPLYGFIITLVILPAIVTVIIMMVGNNIARAFSLAGAFAIIRFRSAPGDPKNIAYVLFTMAVGLATGMGYLLYAAIITVVLCVAMVVIDLTHFGQPKGSKKLLKITIPEDMDYQDALSGVLERFTTTYTLQRIKTTNLGSLYQLIYTVTTKSDCDEKAFIDELRCRNGNLTITLAFNAPTGEF
ncbi:MAG: DUF4956 domain-containing protein [Coriobacteriales bacterium]|jgi:hypothetical protein|nr:DUF4956 domain-containing protein [Coriobacteriales bacterium]